MNPFGLGSVPSPKDERDIQLGKVQAPIVIPESYSTDLSQVEILNQSKQPACIGHATASALMWSDQGEDGQKRDYSPRFLYALAKKDDGIPDQDGTYYRQCFKEAQQYGVCDNALFTNDVSLDSATYKDASLITQQAYDNAQPRIIQAYAALDDLSFQGIKQALYQNKVVLLGVKIGSEWWLAQNGVGSWQEQDILPLRPPASPVGGHAILAYGYDANYIYFRNSWTSSWGRGGDGYFGANYIPQVYEGWTFVDLPDNYVQALIKKKSILQQLVALYQQLLTLLKK